MLFRSPNADLGRHGHGRLAGGRRRDHEPGADLPLLVRALRPGDGQDLQRGELPPTAGIRDFDGPLARLGGPKSDGAGRARPLVVALGDDVRALRRGIAQLRAVDEVEDQARLQRRAAAEIRRRHRAAGAGRLLKPETVEAPLFFGFQWADEAGHFVGGLSDPMRTEFASDGTIKLYE